MKPSLLSISAIATVIAAIAASSSVAGAALPALRSPSGNIKCYYNAKGLVRRVRAGAEVLASTTPTTARCSSVAV